MHEALATYVAGNDPNVEGIAKVYGLRARDMHPLVAMGRLGWDSIREFLPAPMVEYPLSMDGLTGTTDVFSRTDETMAVVDWKTNRDRRDYHPQLLGYAACAADMHGMPSCGFVKVATVWLRLGEIDLVDVRQDDIERFLHQKQRQVMNIGKVYAPGSACMYCRRQLVCSARKEFLHHAVDIFGRGLPSALPLPTLYARVKLLEKAIEHYREALKLSLADGPLPDGLGNTLQLVEQTREKIDPLVAWPILQDQGFTEEELASAVSISSTTLLDVAGDKAAKGYKGKAKAALKERLREAGAMKPSTFEMIKTVKGDRR